MTPDSRGKTGKHFAIFLNIFQDFDTVDLNRAVTVEIKLQFQN